MFQDPSYTPEQKFEYSLCLFSNLPEGQRTDINVIDNRKALCTNQEELEGGLKNGYLTIAYPDHHGLDTTKPIEGIATDRELPEFLCRRGSPTGYNLTELRPDGTFPTTNEIAVPYADNPEAQHVYHVDRDAYQKAVDIIASTDDSNLTEKTKEMNGLVDAMNSEYGLKKPDISEAKLQDYVNTYHNFQNKPDTAQCRLAGGCDTRYGVCGTVAPFHVDADPSKEKLYDGGASQFNTPLPVEDFLELGVLQEQETNF